MEFGHVDTLFTNENDQRMIGINLTKKSVLSNLNASKVALLVVPDRWLARKSEKEKEYESAELVSFSVVLDPIADYGQKKSQNG